MNRSISYSEVAKALRCEAAWDFSYGGHLADGRTFRRRKGISRLSAGSAWGDGVAVWHETGDLDLALEAVWWTLTADEWGLIGKDLAPDPEVFVEIGRRVSACLRQYVEMVPRHEQFEGAEEQLIHEIVPGWEFLCYLDGRMTLDGNPWIVENKFRDSLTDPEIIEKMPQYRWYAVAYRRAHDVKGAVGVMVEERLSRAPEAPKVNKPTKACPDGVVSTDKRQFTTSALYVAECERLGQEPDMETAEHFDQRVWQQSVPLLFLPHELDEAERELESAVMLIDDLDSGARFPIRNGSRSTCQSCDFASICLDPSNDFNVKSSFDVTTPKRLRGEKPEGVR